MMKDEAFPAQDCATSREAMRPHGIPDGVLSVLL